MRIATRFSFTLLFVVLVSSTGYTQTCRIDFDSSCPTAVAECGATFAGGLGCIFAGLRDCYANGSRSYRADANNPVTITIPDGALEIEVFFAHSGAGTQGVMTFFDAVAGGNAVGNPIQTNGDCLVSMPALQSQMFPAAVRRIEVDVSGSGDAWIDAMELTDTTVAVRDWDWGLVKRLYKE